MIFWKSLTGQIVVQITSADVGSALKQITSNNISLYSVENVDELTCICTIFRSDYENLEKLCNRLGYDVRIVSYKGLYWILMGLVQRPVLLFGIVFLLTALTLVPTRILFIQVQGNERIPARRILAAASECGVHFAASREKVRSERVKNNILEIIPELEWAGVNTQGCTAIISVKEKSESQEQNLLSARVSNIVAGMDGVIQSCTVTKGSSICRVGQAVKKGDVLISGYTDCGIRLQATRAEGEIYASTMRNLNVVIPSEWKMRSRLTGIKRRYGLCIGKKRINLWIGSGIWDAGCGRMYREYVLRLPGGFTIPIAFTIDEFSRYSCVTTDISQKEAVEELQSFSQEYLSDSMIAGSNTDKDEIVVLENGVYSLIGVYNCQESIGVVQWEQNGE